MILGDCMIKKQGTIFQRSQVIYKLGKSETDRQTNRQFPNHTDNSQTKSKQTGDYNKTTILYYKLTTFKVKIVIVRDAGKKM